MKTALNPFLLMLLSMCATPAFAGELKDDVPQPAQTPVFSHHGGFVENGLMVAVSCKTEGAEIRFTVNATEPGSGAALYKGPLSVTKPMVLRARAFAQGMPYSEVATATFIPAARPPLPLLCLVTNPRNLHDKETGLHAQVHGRGEEWERPVSVAFFEPDGKPGFSTEAGLRLAGGVSRNFEKHSYRVYFRKKYGIAPLKYPLFGEGRVMRHHCLRVRASGNDQAPAEERWTLMRDALNNTLYSEAGGCATDCRFAVVAINGQIAGVFDIREHCNGDWLREKYGLKDPDLLKVSIYLGGLYAVKDGDVKAWNGLQEFVSRVDLADHANFARLESLVDLDDLINEHAVRFYGNDWDWPQNNRYLFRDRRQGGKWRFVIWDSEWTFDMNGSCGPGADILSGYLFDLGRRTHTAIFVKALSNTGFRHRFLNRCADLLNTVLEHKRVVSMIDAMSSEVGPAVHIETGRWGSSVEQWQQNIEVLRQFARLRPAVFRDQLSRRLCGGRGTFLLRAGKPQVAGGLLRVNSVTLTTDRLPWSGEYFNGVPVRVRAEPGRGFVFTGWAPPFQDCGQEFDLPGVQESEVLVKPCSTWLYHAGGCDPGESWKEEGFKPEKWSEGAAPLGYGEGDEGTVIPFGDDPGAKWTTAYFGKEFVSGPHAEGTELVLSLCVDDGAVVYVNGAEALRVNMQEGAIGPDTPALAVVGGDEERAWRTFTLPANLLREGRNKIAVEVHQANPSSSDLRFDLSLSLTRAITITPQFEREEESF